MPLKIAFLRPQKWSSTTTLLLKHYYRRQGLRGYSGEGCENNVRHKQ